MRTESFSCTYDDMPNCTFYMQLGPSHIPGHCRVRYFTIYDEVYDYISGHFRSPKELIEHMFSMREQKPDMTARLWMYAEELWEAEIKRLEL